MNNTNTTKTESAGQVSPRLMVNEELPETKSKNKINKNSSEVSQETQRLNSFEKSKNNE